MVGADGLIVRIELPMPVAVLDGSLRTVRVGGGERGAHVFEADAVAEQGARLQFDTHGRQGAAAEGHLADARHLGEFLLEHGRRGVVELALAQGARGQRQDHDRGIGGVDLAIGRVAPQAGRQVGPRGVDRGLDIARGAIDVAVQAEL